MENEKPTEAQIKEFWERCGWEYRRSNPHHFKDNVEAQLRDMAWYHPSIREGYVNTPPIDLNHLFAFAVPKAMMQDIHFQFRHQHGKYFDWRCWLRPRGTESKPVYYRDEYFDTPDLALFWAIWEVHKS